MRAIQYVLWCSTGDDLARPCDAGLPANIDNKVSLHEWRLRRVSTTIYDIARKSPERSCEWLAYQRFSLAPGVKPMEGSSRTTYITPTNPATDLAGKIECAAFAA